MVKELKRRTSKTIELRSLNPSHKERTLPVREVVWIARICLGQPVTGIRSMNGHRSVGDCRSFRIVSLVMAH